MFLVLQLSINLQLIFQYYYPLNQFIIFNNITIIINIINLVTIQQNFFVIRINNLNYSYILFMDLKDLSNMLLIFHHLHQYL